MKIVIAVLIALAGAIALAMYASQDPGYVVLSHEPYTVRLPLALFILFALIGFAVFYLLINFIVGLIRTPKKVGKWRTGRKEVSAQQHTMRGFAGLIEGNWEGAENQLLSKVEHNKASLMNYLGAAYAAQQQGQLARRDQHLDAALKEHPRQELAIKLTRARMQMQAGEYGDARDQLEYLRLSAPKNVAAARLLADTYRELGDWPALVKLQPALGKLKAYPDAELERRKAEALEHHIESPALLQGEGNRVDDTFKALPRKAKKDTAAIASYARQLIRSGEEQRAETVLRKALNKLWQPELVTLYGITETRHVGDQIKLLESWGKVGPGHQDETEYLLAMARLCRRDDQLDTAREMLAKVVAQTGDPEAVAELGELLEQMGEHDAALITYKQGLKAATATTTPLSPSIASAAASTEGALVALDSESAVTAPKAMPLVSDPG